MDYSPRPGRSRKLAGAHLVTILGSPALVPALVPPGQHTPTPAQTLSGVPPRTLPPARGQPPDQVPAASGEDLITGIADARFLGYDKPDSFRCVRTRVPIPGETRIPDGRPAWTLATL